MNNWKKIVFHLATTTTMSWRAIADHVGMAKSTVSDYLRDQKNNIKTVRSEKDKNNPRILLFDIETAPFKTYGWKRWKEIISEDMVIQEGFVLCYAARWLGENNIIFDSVWNYHKKTSDGNDYEISKGLYDLFNMADAVIAYNGKSFDVRVMNSRWLYHGFNPPSPYKVIDPFLTIRHKFRLGSNSLKSVAKYIGVQAKIESGGFSLWTQCLNDSKDAQKKMEEYNIGDLEVLEEVYMKVRAWDDYHPNMTLLGDLEITRCPVCLSEDLKKELKNTYTNVSEFDTYRCNNCGRLSRGRKNKKNKEQRENILANVR